MPMLKGTCYDPLPPTNLLMGEKGLVCVYGKGTADQFIKKEMPDVPVGTPMVVCTRELFEHMQKMAMLGHNIVH